MINFNPDEFIRKYGDAPTEDEEGASSSATPTLDTEPKKEETVAAAGSLGGFNPDEFIKKYGVEPNKQAEGGGDYLARQAEYLMSRQPLDAETQLPATEEPRDNSWDTLRGLEVSMRQVPQLAYGVAGLVGETAEQLTGYGESLRDFGFKGYQDWAQSMEPISKETDDVTVAWQRAKEGDVGALVDWAQYGIGYALGQLGETAAVAVLGGIAGGATAAPAGPAAVPAAVGGSVVAAAGKQGFKDLAKNLVEKAIANQANKIVINQAKKEGVELTAEQVAKRAQQEAIKRQAGKEIGSNAAVFANAIGMQLGSIYGSAEEQARAEGRELTGVDLARIWGTGVATGGIEGVVDKFGLDLLKGKLSDKLPAGRLAGAAVAGGVGTLGEAATEAVQTVGERFGAGKDILSDEAINEYINASALGGLGGGAIGGVGGFISGNPKENAAAKAKVSSEANKEIAPATAETVARQADAVIAETVQETPEQRVTRLQEEATAAAGIELEEEAPVSGLPPQPVTPTAEAPVTPAVAPIEPVVEPAVAGPQPAAEVAPEIVQQAEQRAIADFAEDLYGNEPYVNHLRRVSDQMPNDKLKTTAFLHDSVEDGKMTLDEVRSQFGDDVAGLVDMVSRKDDETYSQFIDRIAQNPEAAQIKLADLRENIRNVEDFKPSLRSRYEKAIAKLEAAQPAVTPPAEVAPEVTPAPETPNLEPLRRVARAEQVPEDVPSLVDAGLVEVYKDQPVLTEAGIAQLPEAERPRLNPEARKIQIDTGSNEVVAEAIAKGLRIGVDQVGFNVRMPAGWVLDGDIYVPPTPQEVAPAPEVRESRREPSVEMRQQYAPKTEEEQKAFDKASTNKILARSPQLAVAAVRMKNGEITAGEYADLVDAIDPFTAKGPDPVATDDKIKQYIQSDKVGKVGLIDEKGNPRLQEGSEYEFRIDIPTYNRSTTAGDTVYAITAHLPVADDSKTVGEVAAFTGIAKVTDPRFMTRNVREGGAITIAAGAGKFRLATVKGNYEPITDLPADINDPNVWTEVGYNPIRSSFFVDTRSKDAVVGGSEAIMVGSRVFVKDAVLEPRPTGVTMGERYAKIQMPRPAGMETEAVATKLESLGFGRGGIVSVVNEPDASFEGRTIIRDGKVVAIELNAAALKDDAAVERVLNHEIAESANADGALNTLVAGLTPKERKEINDAITRLGYAEKARTAEEAARAVELLAEGWRGRKWFDRAVARVEAWANKLGYKLTRRAAEYIAARNMAEVNDAFRKRTIADALANLKGARKVNFNGLSAVLIPPSEMEFAYSIAAYHGTPHVIKDGFQLAKIGTGEGAQAYGWGLYFAENIDVAREYQAKLSRDRFKDEATKVYNDWKSNNPKEASIFEDEVISKGIQNVRNEDFAIELQNILDGFRSTEANVSSAEKLSSRISGIGNLYSVDLNIENDKLLDWDSVFAKQSDFIKNALQPIIGQITDANLGELDRFTLGAVLSDFYRNPKLIGLGSKKEVSEFFAQQGIQGIKYFDRASRFAQPKRTGFGWLVDDYRGSNYFKTKEEALEFAKKAATSNFVVFDESLINVTGLNGQSVDIRESRREDAIPTFSEGSPEASTLSTMAASMAKVDTASEAKPNPENKPTYKISEIASVWMDQGGDVRQLQDLISENTNLTPTNAAKVANAIAKQYDIQQSIATAFIETQTGLSVEALPEGVTLPKEVDPDRPRPVMARLFDVFMGVRVPPVKIQVNEKTALKQQIRLKAAANRAAKAEQRRTAEEVVEIIKSMELLGPVRPKQVQALAKRAARVIWTSEKSVEAFSEYAAKVVENTNYDADLREAKDAQKRAKQLSTQKKVAMGPQREVLEDVSKIPVNKLDDPRMFAEAVNYYLRGFKAVLSPDYVVIPDAEMESYLSGAQSETQRNQQDLDREANERLAKKYGIEADQVNEMMESIDIIKQIEAQENREALENLLTEKAVETQQGLREYNTDNLRSEQRPIVSSMLKVDPKALDPEERQRFIRITNNIIYNNQTNGAEYFVAVAKGQQSAREAAQDSEMIAKNRAWINLLPRFVSERMQRGWALELQSVADTFRNAFGKGAMAKVYDAMGMLDLNLGFTKANNTVDEIQKKIADFHRGIEKKYKETARNQDGLLAEGIVGFLIQSIPKKDEVTSINQRRDLIRQDIANRRRSAAQPDRIAMADRIETILNQIDGDSVEAILNNMKRDFPPNYESLIWYKDTLLPQYKDFLKNFDENFNDQANNYDNPNYLTIGFTSAGPSLAITPEEQGMFYDQVSLRPKQSAYTIKRVDYSTLPKDRTTDRPKEIEFNLRRNVFNGLSDQINKAYTSSGWQRIASFMKTPEAETVFGGAANKDFFIERLNRLRLSRMRRGSMGSGGAIEKAVDSLSVISRKLGTGIALGGIYQWIKQPPDQLITALGSGGRADLLAKNIAPSTQKSARELLNKFSIGRRGDASAGYKYINQMEGHQNRLERYFSESKWDQAKEQAGNIADVWMVALKSSDFLAASAAWMTYYEGELNKQDIKIDDWSKEADLIESDPARRQAAAFAEQMTDIYQGSSDPTSMATFAQSGKTGWENFVKAIFVPFNSFAIQQRMRLYSDAVDAINGSTAGRFGLAGTIGGLILFHATKRYVIPAISGVGIGVLYGLMGVDMDEPDEEKQKEEANKNWRQFLADLTGNLLVGGTPQLVETQVIDAMNRASYLVSLQLENDSILNDEGEIMSYDQYSKERSPFYRYKSYDNAMSFGMLDIGMGQAEQVALQTKMLASPEEMEMYTPEEQRLLYFSALSEWLLLMRLNDTDFARLVGKARRDMIKAAEDREKAIKAIRSGR
jgi:hypothetical protein